MSIENLYEIFKKYPEITTDTRKCTPGSIFFALKGANFNGNQYAAKALELGCSYAVVDEKEYATQPNIILVDDSLRTLQELATFHRRKFKIPVIAITGTNGKTTTKELVTSVLSQEHNIISTQGNFNNHIGVPLTLLKMTKKHEIAIIEMGANHRGEIESLCEIAQPDFGLITNIGHAHIEGFGSFENIVKTKGELYDYIRYTEGKAFVNYDNPILRDMSQGLTAIYYGTEGKSYDFVTGEFVSANPYLEFKWKFVSTYHTIKTHLIGGYNLANAMAAIAIGKYFGIKGKLISKALEEYEPTNNRSQLKDSERNMLVVDAYNANPTSMLAALENFSQMEVSKKTLILGDMKELGIDSIAEHQKIVNYIEDQAFKNVLLVGEEFNHTKNNFHCFATLDELTEYLRKNPITDSYVLLKGSRSMKLEDCIELL